MKIFLAAVILVAGLVPLAQAQQEADEKYIGIYSVFQRADTLAASGESRAALAALVDAQTQLDKFQKLFPNWNPNIVGYRQKEIAGKIAALKIQVPAEKTAPSAPAAAVAPAKAQPQTDELQAQLQAAQTDITTLQAKLKEALAAQPAAIDPAELARAQEQIRSLMKDNDLLKVKVAAADTNELAQLRSQMAEAVKSAAAVTAEKNELETKAGKLSDELTKLREANFEGQIKELTGQRDDLKKQLEAAKKKTSAPDEAAAAAIAAQLSALNDEVKTLRSRLAVTETKPVPYTAEELALLSQPTPANPEAVKKSILEMPAGTADLVTSAQKHFANREYEQAEADYLKILDRDKNNGLALANLATIELQQDKFADAEKHLKAALAQSPDDAYNLSTLGFLKFRQEKYDEALDVLSRAAQIDPQNPEIQNYLGVTLSRKGQRQQAETALRKAIQFNPAYAPAHNNLAVLYLSQDPPAPLLARWHYQKALDAGQAHNPDLEKMLADKGAAMPK